MTAALILAAGQTAGKDGSEPLKVGTISALQRIVMVLQRSGIERIVVVCSENQDKTKKLAAHMNLVFLQGGGSDLLDHVKTGLSYLQDKCSAVLLSRADVPLCSVTTIQTLMKAEGPVCVPVCHGKEGYPILLSAEHFPAILAVEGKGSLPNALREAGLRRVTVEVEDEGILENVRTADTRWKLGDDLEELRLDFRVRLIREKAFYGPGTHQLLQLTEETGSLLEACRQMGISYSKGRKIIATTEQQLRYPVIESRPGGRSGGGSSVTEGGKSLIQSYSEFYTEARQYLEELFQKYFGP